MRNVPTKWEGTSTFSHMWFLSDVRIIKCKSESFLITVILSIEFLIVAILQDVQEVVVVEIITLDQVQTGRI